MSFVFVVKPVFVALAELEEISLPALSLMKLVVFELPELTALLQRQLKLLT